MKKMTLGEVIDAVKNGERPEYDDLRYAVCAMDALMTFDRWALQQLAGREGSKVFDHGPMYQLEENFNRVKRAMAVPPKEYVGKNNDPDNPEVQERRSISKKIIDKAMKNTKDE